jgi:hypothetical protein
LVLAARMEEVLAKREIKISWKSFKLLKDLNGGLTLADTRSAYFFSSARKVGLWHCHADLACNPLKHRDSRNLILELRQWRPPQPRNFSFIKSMITMWSARELARCERPLKKDPEIIYGKRSSQACKFAGKNFSFVQCKISKWRLCEIEIQRLVLDNELLE